MSFKVHIIAQQPIECSRIQAISWQLKRLAMCIPSKYLILYTKIIILFKYPNFEIVFFCTSTNESNFSFLL